MIRLVQFFSGWTIYLVFVPIPVRYPFRYHAIVDEQVSKWLSSGVIRLATPGCGWNNPSTTASKRAP